jgi:hypothetical protein
VAYLRIVVLGDFHLHTDEFDLTSRAIEDINECNPDLVVPLGDFGCNDTIGSIEGLRQAYRFLGKLQAPVRPILGNHDMQREIGGRGLQPQGTMQRVFMELFDLEVTNGVIDTEYARFIFIGTDLQSADSCYSDQECFVTDTHFDELLRWLDEAGDKPVIMFTHAPIAGAGLRTVPRVHVRATNAYLDQNHKYDRWLALLRQYGNIKLWFSAHYHLGHDYPDSLTERYGTTFFMTGVHGSCTRDSSRVSRVIDLDEMGVRVSTLDHVRRELRPETDWSAAWAMLAESRAKFESVTASDSYGSGIDTTSGIRLIAECVIGDESSLVDGIIPLSSHRCLVASTDGFLWELAPFEEAVFGTLHLGEPLSAAAVTMDSVWRAWDRMLVRGERYGPYRFQRNHPLATYPHMWEAPYPITALAARADDAVWVACGQHLLSLAADADSFGFVCVNTFEAPIVKLITIGDSGGVSVLTADSVLRFVDVTGSVLAEQSGVVDWDISPCDPYVCVTLSEDDGERTAAITSIDSQLLETWPVGPETRCVTALGGRRVVWIEGAVCHWRDGFMEGCLPLTEDIFRIDAAAHLPDSEEGQSRIGLAVSSDAQHARPILQVWGIGGSR